MVEDKLSSDLHTHAAAHRETKQTRFLKKDTGKEISIHKASMYLKVPVQRLEHSREKR